MDHLDPLTWFRRPTMLFLHLNVYKMELEHLELQLLTAVHLSIRFPMDERSADDVMDELIAEAERRTDKRKKNMLKEEASETFEQHLTSMKKEEELRRMEHLDLDRFMAVVNDPEDPEWRDAYNERWNEFVPGHPLFCDEDKKRIQRWAEKARLGLPRIPADQSIEDKKGRR